MTKKFNTYVNVHRDAANYETFAPGDDVPEWALDHVGDHVYTDVEEDDDPRFRDPHLEPDSSEVGFTTPTALPVVAGGVPSDEAEADEDDDLDEMSKDDLKDLAGRLGLAKSGTKEELIARIREDMDNEDGGDADEDDEE